MRAMGRQHGLPAMPAMPAMSKMAAVPRVPQPGATIKKPRTPSLKQPKIQKLSKGEL
jgi:hypothetical protein